MSGFIDTGKSEVFECTSRTHSDKAVRSGAAGTALAAPVFESLFYFIIIITIIFFYEMLMKYTPISHSIASFYPVYVSVLFSLASPTKFCFNYGDVCF